MELPGRSREAEEGTGEDRAAAHQRIHPLPTDIGSESETGEFTGALRPSGSSAGAFLYLQRLT